MEKNIIEYRKGNSNKQKISGAINKLFVSNGMEYFVIVTASGQDKYDVSFKIRQVSGEKIIDIDYSYQIQKKAATNPFATGKSALILTDQAIII